MSTGGLAAALGIYGRAGVVEEKAATGQDEPAPVIAKPGQVAGYSLSNVPGVIEMPARVEESEEAGATEDNGWDTFEQVMDMLPVTSGAQAVPAERVDVRDLEFAAETAERIASRGGHVGTMEAMMLGEMVRLSSHKVQAAASEMGWAGTFPPQGDPGLWAVISMGWREMAMQAKMSMGASVGA
eukprot:984041-Rhodomonas_salina.1